MLIKPRAGEFIRTYKGIFYPLDPRADEVNIEDIAHGLSNTCRFSGHTIKHYSVAEHSWIMSYQFDDNDPNALWALMHDASEAYITDVPRPVKRAMPIFAEIETNIMNVVCDKFGMQRGEPKEVKRVDYAIFANEVEQCMLSNEDIGYEFDWYFPEPPIAGLKLLFLQPERAKRVFLKRFEELMQRAEAGNHGNQNC